MTKLTLIEFGLPIIIKISVDLSISFLDPKNSLAVVGF